jgi:uncharacterized protein
MRFNVAQLLVEGTGATRRHTFAGELADIDEYNPGRISVEGSVVFTRTLRGILAKGQAVTHLDEPCRRCLEMARADLDFPFEEEYVPAIDVLTGASLPLTDDDEPALVIDEHHTLDLSEVLRQYIVAETTLGPICKEDCQGLCPVCGANRNLEPCTCQTEAIDPRLAILAKLMGSQEEKTAKGKDRDK